MSFLVALQYKSYLITLCNVTDLCHTTIFPTKQLEQKQKYAVWKAADIRKALKEGRRPVPGPPGDEEESSSLSSAPSGDYVRFLTCHTFFSLFSPFGWLQILLRFFKSSCGVNLVYP